MKPYSSFSDQEVAEAIAEAMGWELLGRRASNKILHALWKDHNGETWHTSNALIDHGKLFDPRHSLDQCAVFEEWTLNKGLFDKYLINISNMCGSPKPHQRWLFNHVTATDSKRCEAFLKTMGGREGSGED